MKNGLGTLPGAVKHWGLAASVVIGVIVAGAFTAGPAIAQAVRAALVSNVDDPGRVPYRVQLNIPFQSGVGGGSAFAEPVPAGKRLVITNISGFADQSVLGGTIMFSSVNDGAAFFQFFALTLIGRDPFDAGRNVFVVNQPTLIFFDAGQRPRVSLTAGGTVSSLFTLTGYMLDCSTGPCVPIVRQ